MNSRVDYCFNHQKLAQGLYDKKMGEKIVETNSCRFWLDEDDIFHAHYYDVDVLTLEISQQETEICRALCKNIPVLTMIDISRMKSISDDAINYYASEDRVELHKAVALIVRTQISKVLANQYLRHKKNRLPVKTFLNEKDAFKWLISYK